MKNSIIHDYKNCVALAETDGDPMPLARDLAKSIRRSVLVQDMTRPGDSYIITRHGARKETNWDRA
jgi:hypothetical protein